MFCGRCGKELPNDTRFCPNCGTPVQAAEPMKQGMPAKTQEQHMFLTSSQPKVWSSVAVEKAIPVGGTAGRQAALPLPKKSKKKPIIIASAAIAVIILGIVIYAIIAFVNPHTTTDDKKSQTDTEDVESLTDTDTQLGSVIDADAFASLAVQYFKDGLKTDVKTKKGGTIINFYDASASDTDRDFMYVVLSSDGINIFLDDEAATEAIEQGETYVVYLMLTPCITAYLNLAEGTNVSLNEVSSLIDQNAEPLTADFIVSDFVYGNSKIHVSRIMLDQSVWSVSASCTKQDAADTEKEKTTEEEVPEVTKPAVSETVLKNAVLSSKYHNSIFSMSVEELIRRCMDNPKVTYYHGQEIIELGFLQESQINESVDINNLYYAVISGDSMVNPELSYMYEYEEKAIEVWMVFDDSSNLLNSGVTLCENLSTCAVIIMSNSMSY